MTRSSLVPIAMPHLHSPDPRFGREEHQPPLTGEAEGSQPLQLDDPTGRAHRPTAFLAGCPPAGPFVTAAWTWLILHGSRPAPLDVPGADGSRPGDDCQHNSGTISPASRRQHDSIDRSPYPSFRARAVSITARELSATIFIQAGLMSLLSIDVLIVQSESRTGRSALSSRSTSARSRSISGLILLPSRRTRRHHLNAASYPAATAPAERPHDT